MNSGQERLANNKVVLEPAREIRVCYEADVVVVGGGPAGHSAAVAAARNGAKTVLIERYGHLGGMATGGLVILIPHMSDGTKEQQIAGLCQEWLERLDSMGGALHPKKEELGSSDAKVTARLKRYFSFVVGGRVRQSYIVDPELLKCVLNDMVEEKENIKLLLHSWGSRAFIQNGDIQGVIFESKSGRRVVLGEIIIDATGDGDIFASAGADFDAVMNPELRNSQLALVFRLGNVNFNKYSDFNEAEPEKHGELMKELQKMVGTRLLPLPSSRNDVVWVNNWISDVSSLDVEDLSSVEVSVRKKMLLGHKFFKEKLPGFENSFILDTASQVGTRGSRRLTGDYIVTMEDVKSGKVHEDTIAVFPKLQQPADDETHHVFIPYRSLLPKKIERMLVAGRCFASDSAANDQFNLIPHCAAMGEAAGTAAALAIKHGISPRQVNYKELQNALIKQGVPLPVV